MDRYNVSNRNGDIDCKTGQGGQEMYLGFHGPTLKDTVLLTEAIWVPVGAFMQGPPVWSMAKPSFEPGHSAFRIPQ